MRGVGIKFTRLLADGVRNENNLLLWHHVSGFNMHGCRIDFIMQGSSCTKPLDHIHNEYNRILQLFVERGLYASKTVYLLLAIENLL